VYVIDSADRKRIDECGVELAQLLEVRARHAATAELQESLLAVLQVAITYYHSTISDSH
jgi:hypothetical protein